MPETSKLSTKYFHNFEGGQRVLEFGQRNGKLYYKIQKYVSKKYSWTGPRVIVTLGPTNNSKGPGLGRTVIFKNLSFSSVYK